MEKDEKEAEQKVDKAKQEVEEAKQEVKKAEQKVEEAEQKVKEAEQKRNAAEQKVKEAKQKMEEREKEMKEAQDSDSKLLAKTHYEYARSDYQDARSDYQDARTRLHNANKGVTLALDRLEQASWERAKVIADQYDGRVQEDSIFSKKKAHVENLKKFLFYTSFKDRDQNTLMGCATAYSKYKLATFAHGLHNDLKVGDKVNVYSVIGKTEYTVNVVTVDKAHDFILLQSSDELCSLNLYRRPPYEGEGYIQLGLSAMTQEKSPFALSQGVFTSTQYNCNGHFLGSAGANPGDSGGGCFGKDYNILFGMNVGCEAVPISGGTTLFELGQRHPARAHIVPSAYFE